MLQINSDTAYILHYRKYTDTQLIIDIFTRKHGRMSAVYRTPSRKKQSLLPQPFTPFCVSLYGRTELKKVTQLEALGIGATLKHELLYCGLYINELLTRLLMVEEHYANVFERYVDTIAQLQLCNGDDLTHEKLLRIFELQLLNDLGYGLEFSADIQGEAINADRDYVFVPEQGFVAAEHSTSAVSSVLPGRTILAIQNCDWQEVKTLKTAKYICRAALKCLLGDKPLKTRELFNLKTV